ncbi:sialidase family protein [Allorhodopirellula heiligendammensis]|uniref:BNR/Asp-box repeat protein n=1 Tax=Allorhodopirellula heiligendammensis TaxID=2714739 RepID=A0A5C6C5N4_9BACT|nr:sialidase family protein [Allorhodopirellula heiligendammensis]TWU19950.1 hypothetical protein Poly21_21290 [Allorhodopirellula heiligendammensis]
MTSVNAIKQYDHRRNAAVILVIAITFGWMIGDWGGSRRVSAEERTQVSDVAEAFPQVEVPGVVIDHSPASSGLYIGSPSIAILPNGAYVASHDFFGPKSGEHSSATTAIFRSEDRGRTWTLATHFKDAFWCNLFVHNGSLYLFGTTRHHGLLVIRRSDDGGITWTEPRDAETGVLTEAGEYHTSAVPVVAHSGRLWRAVEDASNGKKWGARYGAMMMSAPVDADLLRRESWTFSNVINRDPKWMEGRFEAFLEGNAVVSPAGHVVDIMRMHDGGQGGKAAIVRISRDGEQATFDPMRDTIEFPGGAKKFTIRFDPQSQAYWSLTNLVVPIARQAGGAAASIRNTLALVKSTDLKSWETKCILLYHPDTEKHAFQYPDWQFDGDDLIAAIRTAFDDGQGGAHRAHDANYLTFHRFIDFRTLEMSDSIVDITSLGLPSPPKLD